MEITTNCVRNESTPAPTTNDRNDGPGQNRVSNRTLTSVGNPSVRSQPSKPMKIQIGAPNSASMRAAAPAARLAKVRHAESRMVFVIDSDYLEQRASAYTQARLPDASIVEIRVYPAGSYSSALASSLSDTSNTVPLTRLSCRPLNLTMA